MYPLHTNQPYIQNKAVLLYTRTNSLYPIHVPRKPPNLNPMLFSNSKHIPNPVTLARPFFQWPRRNAAFDGFGFLCLRSTDVKPRKISGCASVEQEDGRPSIWTIHRPSRLRVLNLEHHTGDLSNLAGKVIMTSSCDRISWLFYREELRYVVRCVLCINIMNSGAVCLYPEGTLEGSEQQW